MTREDCLNSAKMCVCSDRESQYGSPEDSFDLIARYWTTYLKYDYPDYIKLKSSDVAAMMALMKMARIQSGRFKADSYVDACGYLACGCEIKYKEEAKDVFLKGEAKDEHRTQD